MHLENLRSQEVVSNHSPQLEENSEVEVEGTVPDDTSEAPSALKNIKDENDLIMRGFIQGLYLD
jgi:hypothetical protein